MSKLNKLIVWALYYAGHITCKIGFVNTILGFKFYNWNMTESVRLQDLWGYDLPWKGYDDHDQN